MSNAGTTECAALLRYFGLRAEVVDFGIDEYGRYLTCKHAHMQHIIRPSDAVCDACGCLINSQADGKSYCCVSCDYDLCQVCYSKRNEEMNSVEGNSNYMKQGSILSFVSTSSSGRIRKPSPKSLNSTQYDDENEDGWEHHSHLLNNTSKRQKISNETSSPITSQLVNWLTSYFRLKWPNDFSPTPEKAEYYLPPLYFQHEGHSRTIVGLEDMNGKTSLIIFDPLSNGALLKRNMEDDLASANGIYICSCD